MPTNRLPQFQKALGYAGLEVADFARGVKAHRATVFRCARGDTDNPILRAEIEAVIRDYPPPRPWRPLLSPTRRKAP